MTDGYLASEPGRDEIDALPGASLLEFGSPYCGHCLRAQALIVEALAAEKNLAHMKIFDGPGRPLGRSFFVKLWPTLILMVDGVEIARVVRPQDAASIRHILAQRESV
jgi:thioredoxin 1